MARKKASRLTRKRTLTTTRKPSKSSSSKSSSSKSSSSKSSSSKSSSSKSSSSSSKEKTAGDIIRESRSKAKSTGGDPNVIAGQIGRDVIAGRSTPEKTGGYSLLSDAPKMSSLAGTTQGGSKSAEQTKMDSLNPQNNPYLRQILPYTMGDIPVVQKMSTGQKQALADLISSGVLPTHWLGQIAKGIGAMGKAGSYRRIVPGSDYLWKSVEDPISVKMKAILPGAKTITSKTATLIGSAVAKAAKGTVNSQKGLYVLGGIVGSYMISEWAMIDNAKQGLNIAATNLKQVIESNPEQGEQMLNEYHTIYDEVYTPSTFDKVARVMPGVNFANAIRKAGKVAVFQASVNDAYLGDVLTKVQNGEDDKAYFERIRLQKLQDQTDYLEKWQNIQLETQRLKEAEEDRDMLEDAEFHKEQRQDKRAEEKSDREASGDYWRQHEIEMQKIAEEERIRIQEFWIAYRTLMMKMQAESAPSRLGFGLL